MEKDRTKILNKVKKLLAMAEGGTKHEQEVAYFQAQKLMAKYHIEMHDVRDLEKEKAITIYVGEEYNIKKDCFMKLQHIIGKNFRCKTYYSYPNKKTFLPRFVGFETDVTVAVEVFKSAYDYAKNEANRIAMREYNTYGSSMGVRDDFIDGFIAGLAEGFRKQLEESKETAIMIVIPKEVEEEYQKITFSLEVVKTTPSKGSGAKHIMRAGYEKGKMFAEGKEQQELGFSFTPEEHQFMSQFQSGYLFRKKDGKIYLSQREPLRTVLDWKSPASICISDMTDLFFNALSKEEFIRIDDYLTN